ncbi:hypothetical protein F3Y22_tig00110676pilonHSYRG00126 [Hibiscus syriacus]|uniref:Uncharacterized protein n=1 Tax=Hibiscus syriacus TaxID=106335 RepID=A0A6A2ZVY5_HIBSY|nr:hypothetical protein F3Y22_tig00110676pilonHSYRG00126 [Hibiscus syriacus]
MGCGISKFDNPKGGDASHRSDERDRFHSSREEACTDKESSNEEDLYDGDDGISYLRSPSFRVYCVPSQLDDGITEGDSTPEEIKDDQKMVAKNFKKKMRLLESEIFKRSTLPFIELPPKVFVGSVDRVVVLGGWTVE